MNESDPHLSWQDSARGLLPGTAFAILLCLAAVAAAVTGHTVIAIIIGVLAGLNTLVAIQYWARLLSR